VNGARVTFVNSSVEDPPAPPPRRSKHHQRNNHGSSAKDSEIRSCAAPSGTKEAIYHPLAQLGASNACQFDKPGAQVIHVVRPNPLAKHPSEYTEAERNAAALRTSLQPGGGKRVSQAVGGGPGVDLRDGGDRRDVERRRPGVLLLRREGRLRHPRRGPDEHLLVERGEEPRVRRRRRRREGKGGTQEG
jgi:hypothetical protein